MLILFAADVRVRMEVEQGNAIEVFTESGESLRKGSLSLLSRPVSSADNRSPASAASNSKVMMPEDEYFVGDEDMEPTNETPYCAVSLQSPTAKLRPYVECTSAVTVPKMSSAVFKNVQTNQSQVITNSVQLIGSRDVDVSDTGTETHSSFIVKNNRRQNVKLKASLKVIAPSISTCVDLTNIK
jgi:hypothetical protein